MQLEIYSLIALKDQISVSLEAICDSYSSLLWDIEFYQCGCFEVYIAASPQNVSIFQRGRIVARSDDAQHFGIIESLQLETDAEKGDYLTVTGRFLACLLERRIIYPTITANGSYPTAPVGGFEAEADSANTVQLTNCQWAGPADANGIAELRILTMNNA